MIIKYKILGTNHTIIPISISLLFCWIKYSHTFIYTFFPLLSANFYKLIILIAPCKENEKLSVVVYGYCFSYFWFIWMLLSIISTVSNFNHF